MSELTTEEKITEIVDGITKYLLEYQKRKELAKAIASLLMEEGKKIWDGAREQVVNENYRSRLELKNKYPDYQDYINKKV